MNIFDTHRKIIEGYSDYIRSFINISDPEIRQRVDDSLSDGLLWPQPLLQFNPAYEMAGSVEDVINAGLLHDDTRYIFKNYSLYYHQYQALELSKDGNDFVVTSGTGSGKSLTYIGTIFNHLLSNSQTEGVIAVIVYPMNALINSQTNEFNTYKGNYETSTGRDFPITFGQYTGQEKEERREKMRSNPPQILLTNYMMLELLLTRVQERPICEAIFNNLQYLVFDELHTYRGRKGADISMLIRRIQSQCKQSICYIGTSATMVSMDDRQSQREQVARTASTIFGRPFKPSQIIDETLEPSLGGTIDIQPSKQELQAAITAGIDVDASESDLVQNPVMIWLENCIALESQKDGQITRRKPMRIEDIINQLVESSGISKEKCQGALEMALQWISNVNKQIQDEGSPYTLLPFKLHQFINQTGSVYTTLDQGNERFITLEPGIYKHDDNRKPIFPNVFSRATGHPFMCVSLVGSQLMPREFRETGDEDETSTDGYLIIGEDIWNPDQDIHNLPSAWVRTRAKGKKEPTPKIKSRFPRKLYFDETGNCSETDPMKYSGWFMQSPLLFDPTGGVIYNDTTSEGTKLTRLGSEGRSTSTTILSFLILNHLGNRGYSLQDQKLLSFTDNRQDAALQSGHFDDFVQVVRLRAGILQALKASPDGVLYYATLGEAIYRALALPFSDYAKRDEEPSIAYVKKRYEEALQAYLLFRALADLRRGWRIVLPNLEQCALLSIDYIDLEKIVCEDEYWADTEIVNQLDHSERREFITSILDFFRYEYAIHSENYLVPKTIKEFENKFREILKPPWTIDKKEELSVPSVIRIDPLHKNVRLSNRSIGPTSSLGKYIKSRANEVGVGPDFLRGDRYRDYILQLMRKLKDADYLIEESAKSAKNENVPVFRLRIEKILWKLGDGKTIRPDPIKRLSYRGQEQAPNSFFGEIYQWNFTKRKQLRAGDHTGQLGVETRKEREDRFRADWHLDESGKTLDQEKIRRESISALFCSPTMELGVDIGGLSVVHMRNAPPNAANYVQRSGRAGRSGQGALIFTYCSSFSPHDRHYFNHQQELVAGSVLAPRIDLCNQDLLLTHLHALAISTIGLPGLDSGGRQGKASLVRLITDDHAKLPISPGVKQGLEIGPKKMEEITTIFCDVIGDFAGKLKSMPNAWYTDDWTNRNLLNLETQLDKAMERWRKLYLSAYALLTRVTGQIESGLLRVGSDEYKKQTRLQSQSTRQINLLRNEQPGGSFDFNEFYPYRYLASEGFLPGYNFTRLPLRVFVPTGNTAGEYISRSRSIALREFGPRNIIYHNGRKYRVTQLVTQDADSSLMEAKISKQAGYFLMGDQSDLEICPFSNLNLSDNANTEYLHDLLEMTESRSEEIARITCAEEERISRGFDLSLSFHVDRGDFVRINQAVARSGESQLLNLRFIPAARLISLNKGWRSRKNDGFPIGMTSGNWRNSMPESSPDTNEEHRLVKLWTSNIADILYIEPIEGLGLDPDGVVTLQYALKRAIETVLQVEPGEIDVDAIGAPEHPNILLYEASEGSLGILSQFVEDTKIFRNVIKTAEEICRFNDEEYKAPASYDDLLSYYNQRDHHRLDRFLIRDALEKLKIVDIELQSGPDSLDYDEQYKNLLRQIDPNSSTERVFIDYLHKNGLRLPDDAQKRVEGIYCQPDFYYEPRIWIFCDGSPHDDPQVRERDEKQRQLIIARGDEVWSWHYLEDLADRISQRPDIFRKVR